jgi:beta-glucosidase
MKEKATVVRVFEGTAAWPYVLQSEGEERERRIAELLSSMTLKDKIAQMHGSAGIKDLVPMLLRYGMYPFKSGANKRLGIPAIKFTDGPRGVTLGHSTCFPVSIARGATWDSSLEKRVASAMGAEACARGSNFFAGVCINLLRHPGWGRAQETFGEDPCLLGAMGSAMVRGLNKHLMACAKHFACNSIEESRFYVDVRIDERTLREVYLPHFKKCVEAGVSSIMSAYNRVNGEYCSHNSHLLRDILKGDWGFDGLVMSDFVYGTRDTLKAAGGGLDIEMPAARYFGNRLEKAVKRGELPEELVDDSVTRILRHKARFAVTQNTTIYPRDIIAGEEHTQLAYEAASKSLVLLKNEDAALPLRHEHIKRVAVIGELAKEANLGDHGSSRVRPPYAVTPLQGIKERAGKFIDVMYYSGRDLSKASRTAAGADAVIVVVGLTYKEEGEAIPALKAGGDREDLTLPSAQVELIEAASAANKRCIVVVEGGSAVIMESWREKVRAILMAWYPGMEGGNALAAILFGEENPSGKLPVTFPRSSDQLPPFDSKARSVEYGRFHGYRLCDVEGFEPAFPFGFGLSYTTYAYSNLRLSASEITRSGSLEVSADISNTGDMAGCEIAQLYLGYAGSGVERPVKELKAFSRVDLEPGETKTVSHEIKARDLAYYAVESGSWEIEEIEYTLYLGSSSRREDLHLSESFRVRGP